MAKGYAWKRGEIKQPTHPMRGVRFEMVGEDWKKLDGLFEYFSSDSTSGGIKRDIAKAARDFATRLKGALISGVLTEGASINQNWAQHSPETIDRWGVHGIMRLNDIYISGLEAMQPVQQRYTVTLTLPSSFTTMRSHKGGETLGVYAMINEYGSKKRSIPARPLWRPAYKSIGGSEALANKIRSGVGRRLNEKGINMKVK